MPIIIEDSRCIKENADSIKQANGIDLKESIEHDLSSSLIKRLDLFKKVISLKCVKRNQEVTALENPTEQAFDEKTIRRKSNTLQKTVPISGFFLLVILKVDQKLLLILFL